MIKVLKVILIVLLLAFIVIQFFKPAKDIREEIPANQITAIQNVPENVQQILKVSCYDCHSNTTHFPWYDHIQPVTWVLQDHIVEGKKELNFSEFATYPVYRRYKKFKEIQQQIKEDEMPIFSYTILHREAVLSAEQKSVLIDWAASSMKEMEAQYPADSLVRKK
ncbi:MAG: heme-binding domain-containing protein [Ginsengibacter sp.]